ncbi:MAG: aminotransferase class I/II-fold pyridoxal phosphate-dependent enzyme [Acidimicrobiales bacterium]|jgi:succinyldiaminopimelate transaminase|nr:aminotransferase class I/II-fold pyridoxal phosphate-dependent enzyme [Acidimicrobiales bacterium]
MAAPAGFVPPPYPYDRLADVVPLAEAHEGGVVDLSIGTPCDPPPQLVLDALARSGAERGYPPSVGSPAYREAAAGWLERRLGVTVAPSDLAACIGTKELVAGVPHWLRLRDPSRDTVLYPAVSYPTYAMGATLAGARAVPVGVRPDGALDLDAVDPTDADRAICLWVNTPANPTGALGDLAAEAAWGRRHDVPVFSDECYVEFTWSGRRRTILEHGPDGVVAVHSLSKRSNLAGARAGFYAGDGDLVHYLSEVRKHAGFMVPGPVQAAAVAAWDDDRHVDEQCDRYRRRLEEMARVLTDAGVPAGMPDGAFYLWVAAPDGDAWALTRRLARDGGVLVSPGEFYGPGGAAFVRVAVVQPDDRIALVARRLSS